MKCTFNVVILDGTTGQNDLPRKCTKCEGSDTFWGNGDDSQEENAQSKENSIVEINVQPGTEPE